ncbi:hypothetical protein SMA5143A_0699 [Streptomyces sp. MA5143a]|nr:hypothetical protein SMA5143A_0699 [Streptomyces sp. MA5143a]
MFFIAERVKSIFTRRSIWVWTAVSGGTVANSYCPHSSSRPSLIQSGLIREILIHSAVRSFSVWNPERVEVLWRWAEALRTRWT